MLIFYDKQTGRIIGLIEGRFHEESNKLWMGGDTAERMIINWVKNKDGAYEPNIKKKSQKELFQQIEKKPIIIYDYKVDVKSEELVKSPRKQIKKRKIREAHVNTDD